MIYEDKTDDWYDQLEGVRASWLKTLRSSTPAHLFARMQAREDSDALRVGRAVHCKVLTPTAYADGWVTAPKVDRRTKEGKAAWESFVELASGKGIVTAEEQQMLDGVFASITQGSGGRLVGMCDLKEVVLTGEIAGVPCKARIDGLSTDEGLLIDIKTCVSASPRAFTRSIVDFGYHLQLAFYRELMRQNGLRDGAHVLIACEKAPPYGVACYAIPEPDIARTKLEIEGLVLLYQQCVDSGEWPCYPRTVQNLHLPEWAFKEDSTDE